MALLLDVSRGQEFGQFGICPQGYWCGVGSAVPEACVPGKMSSALGLEREDQCRNCSKGYYCPESGTVTATDLCWAGYYCPSGTATPTLLCELGSYCPNGSAVSIPCAPGTYANVTGLPECLVAPPGFYAELGQIQPQRCPRGFACPAGTEFGSQYPCPNGTYGERSGLVALTQCTPCTAGSYCGETGLSNPSGLCDEGFFCGEGSNTPSPGDGVDRIYLGDTCVDQSDAEINGVCPPGHYCPEGSSSPTACPPGFESAARGLANVTQCQACTPGYQCPESGIVNATVPCDPGFYCPGNDITPTYLCPLGKFCAGGDPAPVPCAPGSYANVTGLAACLECDPSYYCLQGQIQPIPCPSGSYCPAGTTAPREFLCPNRTFSNRTLLRSLDECQDCLPGSYCEVDGLSWPTGLCDEGFFCGEGSNTPSPADGVDRIYVGDTCVDQSDAEVNGVCPPGHYCPEGSSSPTACPPGFESAARGLANVTQCQACTPGYQCPESGTVNATVPCDPGFYCPGNDITPTYLCPLGKFCAGGDPAPIPCAPGSYANVTGLAACLECDPSYYCLQGQIQPIPCPSGSYCPAGTTAPTEFLCPNSTFSNRTLLRALDECQDCLPGYYCEVDGLSWPTGLCDEGFFCGEGSNTPSPGDGVDRIYVGDTCVDQSDAEVNGVCPPGHYCPEGSSSPTACPPGFESAARGLANVTQCQACTPGYQCPESGTVNATVPCDPGFYCPGNDITPTYLCPLGKFCAGGDPAPIPCAPGSYANVTGLAACLECDPSYYCLQGQIQPIPCPSGSYCPAGTTAPTEFLCPNGTFSNRTLLRSLDECQDACRARIVRLTV